jgi:hypothetical protein
MAKVKQHKNAMRRLRARGWSDTRIAAKFGVSASGVAYVLGRNPVRWKRPTDHPAAFIHRARALWDQGLSQTAIGHALGVTPNVIAGIGYRQDWPPRGTAPEYFRGRDCPPSAV